MALVLQLCEKGLDECVSMAALCESFAKSLKPISKYTPKQCVNNAIKQCKFFHHRSFLEQNSAKS